MSADVATTAVAPQAAAQPQGMRKNGMCSILCVKAEFNVW